MIITRIYSFEGTEEELKRQMERSLPDGVLLLPSDARVTVTTEVLPPWPIGEKCVHGRPNHNPHPKKVH